MQKLISSIKTLSRPSRISLLNLSYTCSGSLVSPALVARRRSYASDSTTGEFGRIPMASSATGKLPATGLEDGLGKKLWIKFRKEWTEALYTPFVISLAAGNLKLNSFRDYVAQDVYFLRAFLKALVIRTSKAFVYLYFIFRFFDSLNYLFIVLVKCVDSQLC